MEKMSVQEEGKQVRFVTSAINLSYNSDSAAPWIHLPESNVNVFHFTWMMYLRYSVKLTSRVLWKLQCEISLSHIFTNLH